MPSLDNIKQNCMLDFEFLILIIVVNNAVMDNISIDIKFK